MSVAEAEEEDDKEEAEEEEEAAEEEHQATTEPATGQVGGGRLVGGKKPWVRSLRPATSVTNLGSRRGCRASLRDSPS